MAEHNIDNLSKALEEAQKALAPCQKERTAAKQVVEASADLLRRIRSTLHYLQRERDLRRKSPENADELENLINQLQNKQEEEARAKQNLQDAQRTLREVENQAPPSQSQAPGQEGHGVNADEIQKKQKEEQEAQGQIRDACEVLKEKKRAVLDTAVTVTRQAAKIPLKRAKAVVSNLATQLQSFGGVGLGYGYAVSLGAVYEFVFYRLHGINIFLYSTPTDFLLSGYKLFYIPLLSFVPALILLFFYWLLVKLACYRIPGYAEIVAQGFPRFAQGIPIKSIGAFLFLALPLATTVVVGYLQFKQGSKAQVSIATVPPLQREPDGPFFRLGENSTYLFLKSTPPNDAPILPVQLSRIAYTNACEAKDPEAAELDFRHRLQKIKNWLFPPAPIRECKDDGVKTAEPSAAVSEPGAAAFGYEMLKHVEEIKNDLKRFTLPAAHKHEDHVTEKPFQLYIAEYMNCAEGEVQLSDFIRFDRNKPGPQYQAPYFKKGSLQGRAIQEFAEKNGEEGTQWTVLGFASLDGSKNTNSALAGRRAKAVGDVLRPVLNDKGQEILIKGIGEEHPINGVANGRSAVIAVCVKKNASAVGQGEDISGKG